MDSDLAKTLLQGGWFLAIRRHEQPKCVNVEQWSILHYYQFGSQLSGRIGERRASNLCFPNKSPAQHNRRNGQVEIWQCYALPGLGCQSNQQKHKPYTKTTTILKIQSCTRQSLHGNLHMT